MKEKRVTKRAIFASLLSVAVCTSMLIGTSYAWFTDSVTSANNKIQSGTLKIDVQVKGGDTGYTDYTSIRNTSNPIFNYDKWEPGYTSWTNVKVLNDGNLAFKYTMRFTSDNDIANEPLAEVIDVYYSPTEIPKTTRPADLAATALVKIGTLKDVFNGTVPAIDDYMLPNDSADYATIVLKMQETAGNAYQNQTLSAFDLQVMAMQYAYEKDTFDEHYDDKANGIPDHPEWGNLNTSASAPVATSGATVVEATGAKLTVPAGAATGDTVAFSVTPDTTGNNTITINDGQTQMVYDITVTGTDGTTDTTVELNIGAGKTGVTVSHNGTAMDTADYDYDAATGILTITSATFSPFQIVFDEVAGVRTVATADELKAALDDTTLKTITLTQDITINGGYLEKSIAYTKEPAFANLLSSNVTLDGNGKTITLSGQNGKTYFLAHMEGTIKNLTINGANQTLVGDVYSSTATFDNVKLNGEFASGQNNGGWVTYVWGNAIKFVNCESNLKMTGDGTGADYEAVFIGYFVDTGVKATFENCVNKGSIIGSYACMFVANPRSSASAHPVVTINNCSNEGTIRRTKTTTYLKNMFYGATGYTVETVVDGTTYAMADVEADAMTAAVNKGTFTVGPIDDTLKLDVGADGYYVVTAATAANVDHYVVSRGIYTTLIKGGTGVYNATQVINASDFANNTFTTGIKSSLKFVDKTWTENNSTATRREASWNAGQVSYVLDGVEYAYIENEDKYTTNGNAVNGYMVTVSAYDANGNILATF